MILQRPFLTDLDPRARIKGSRDPLGFQSLWSALGRSLVENLTTVTVSLRGFTTVIIGFYYIDRLVEEGKILPENYTDTFLKFEQLAAYSRVAWKAESKGIRFDEDEIRGILRVMRNLSGGSVRISAEQKHQILSNQRTYGLWGLYTVASRTSGLIDREQVRLLPAAAEFVEAEYARKLGSESSGILRFLERDRDFEPKGKDSKLAARLAGLMSPQLSKAEKHFYFQHLLLSDKEEGIQKRVWETIESLNDSGAAVWEDPFSLVELKELIKRARISGDTELADRAERIRNLESVIAPAARLFSFILSRNGQLVDAIAKQVKTTWGNVLSSLDVQAVREAIVATGGAAPGDEVERLVALAEQLKKADYRLAVETMLELNRRVMQDRGAAPWIVVKKGKLDIRLSEEPRELPSRKEVRGLWGNPYFLSSLKSVGYQIVKVG